MESFASFCNSLIEYETPKVVTVHNPLIGMLRRALQLGVVLYVCLYQLWYAQGYQEFSGMESSVTTKVTRIIYNLWRLLHHSLQVKGYSQSILGPNNHTLPPSLRILYERVWDEADYVVPPAENGAFFVTTNVVITPNQTLGHCAEASCFNWNTFIANQMSPFAELKKTDNGHEKLKGAK